MLRLILMRHAKSDWSYAGKSDHERPLNKRGRASAVALGDWLRSASFSPEQVMCSSAERTGETLHNLALEPKPDTRFTRDLYLADAQDMLKSLNTASDTCVLMIAHNPGICEFANRLVEDPPDHDRFADYPTGATLVCDFDRESWKGIEWFSGRVVDFVVPRDLLP